LKGANALRRSSFDFARLCIIPAHNTTNNTSQAFLDKFTTRTRNTFPAISISSWFWVENGTFKVSCCDRPFQ
jgi:hypothetical protein